MHGRPRKAYKPEEEAASAAKAVKLRSLQNQFMSNHHAKMYKLSLSLIRLIQSSVAYLNVLGFLVIPRKLLT